MKRIGHCFIFLFLLNVSVWGQVQFATARLEAMASLLPLDWSRLTSGDNYEYSYSGHLLHVRVNQWNEIDHIGYRLFSTEVRTRNPLPIYDFLERYFLELDLSEDIDKSVRLAIDKVQLSNRDLNVIHQFDGSETLKIDMLNLKKYQVSWSKDGQEIQTITFDMDYQLLSGCNIVEAEEKLLKELQRHQPDSLNQASATFPEADSTNHLYWQKDQGTYILDEIRHTLYYERDETQKWKLVCDTLHPLWSTFNLMLSKEMSHNCYLETVVDLYGYNEKEILVSLKKWIDFCISQGCKSYLGIKTHTDETITGTVFIVNEKMGYNHMLSIELNKDIIATRKGNIKSRLYAYIPLHNVSDDYFQFYSLPNVNTLK